VDFVQELLEILVLELLLQPFRLLGARERFTENRTKALRLVLAPRRLARGVGEVEELAEALYPRHP
jgi:hypothetical protein